MHHIALNADDNFSLPLKTAVFSYCETNPEPTVVHVLSEHLAARHLRDLERITAAFGHDFEYHPIEQGRFEDGDYCSVSSATTCFRYLLPDCLPNVDRVLYIDCDLLVRGSLAPIFKTDLTGRFAAAVTDTWMQRQAWLAEIQREYGVKRYFNAGVLWFNLALMREEKLVPQLLELDRIRFPFRDQDVLNAAFVGRTAEMPETYNLIDPNRATPDTVILHFTGGLKPWFGAYGSLSASGKDWRAACCRLERFLGAAPGTLLRREGPLPTAPQFGAEPFAPSQSRIEAATELNALRALRAERPLDRSEENRLLSALVTLGAEDCRNGLRRRAFEQSALGLISLEAGSLDVRLLSRMKLWAARMAGRILRRKR